MLNSNHMSGCRGWIQYVFDCFLYDVSSRKQAGGCQLRHLTQQANTPISLKYLAELSVVRGTCIKRLFWPPYEAKK